MMIILSTLLAVLLVVSMIERQLLLARHSKERAADAAGARQERSELAARVQGLTWRPEQRETPTQELVEEPDELGMVGQIVHGENHGE